MKILINEKEKWYNDIYSIKGQIATDVEEMGKVKML